MGWACFLWSSLAPQERKRTRTHKGEKDRTQQQPGPDPTGTNPIPPTSETKSLLAGSMDGSHANAASAAAGGGEGTQRTLYAPPIVRSGFAMFVPLGSRDALLGREAQPIWRVGDLV